MWPWPGTTLMTPGGKPTSRASSATRRVESGVSTALLHHHAVPAASAGPSFQLVNNTGNSTAPPAHHAHRHARDVVQEAGVDGNHRAFVLVGHAGEVAEVATVRITSRLRVSRIGWPVSRVSISERLSRSFSMASASLPMSTPRSDGDTADHAGNALRAAATARSMSAAWLPTPLPAASCRRD